MLGIRWLIGATAFLTASLLAASTGWAAVVSSKHLSIDLTDAKDAQAKATWSDPKQLTINENGLGWDGEANALREGWIQTKPLAIGYQWRPPSSAGVTITIQPAPQPFTLPNGQTSTPYAGTAYVRYSPDRKHWSSWHACHSRDPHTREPENRRIFQGSVGVPRRVLAGYHKLLKKFADREETWWPDDEEKAVRWIVGRDPDYFAKQQPIVGYIEVLFETNFYGGQRIKSVDVSVGYVLSGRVAPPKDGDYRGVSDFNEEKPWRFVPDKSNKTTPTKENP